MVCRWGGVVKLKKSDRVLRRELKQEGSPFTWVTEYYVLLDKGFVRRFFRSDLEEHAECHLADWAPIGLPVEIE
jgi:hypothetical protein